MAPDDNPHVLIPEELAVRAERFGERIAVQVVDGSRMTFAEWKDNNR